MLPLEVVRLRRVDAMPPGAAFAGPVTRESRSGRRPFRPPEHANGIESPPNRLTAERGAAILLKAEDGGESGIRTHGRVSPTHAFQACSFNHSDISPSLESTTCER